MTCLVALASHSCQAISPHSIRLGCLLMPAMDQSQGQPSLSSIFIHPACYIQPGLAKQARPVPTMGHVTFNIHPFSSQVLSCLSSQPSKVIQIQPWPFSIDQLDRQPVPADGSHRPIVTDLSIHLLACSNQVFLAIFCIG